MDSGTSASGALTVAQLLPAMSGGGVERGTLEVATELARTGNRALVMSAGGAMVPAVRAAGGEHIAWPIGRKSPLTLMLVSRLRRWLRDERVDVLHARSRLPAWIAYLAWKGMAPGSRPRFITTVHGFYSPGRYSAIMTRGERVECVSEAIVRYVQENYPQTPSQRLRLIHRGVDRTQFPFGHRPSEDWLRGWREQYPLRSGVLTLTLPGRLARLKGHQSFIEIMRRLAADGIAVQGLIVGGEQPGRAGYAEEIRAGVAEAGLNDHVVFTGHRSDMRDIYAASDAVLSLSTQPESFGRAALEALSVGTPVIGFDHGGVGEILREIFPWGAVPVGDMRALENKLRSLRNAPAVPPEHPFTLRAMLDATLGLYREVAHGH